MKSTRPFLLGLLLLTAPASAQAQFNYTINGGIVTITGYAGFGPIGTLIIPATLNNLPVTGIGADAFNDLNSLTNVMIPASVTNIGNAAFSGCAYLTTITVDAQNSFYSSTNGVLFDKTLSTLVEFPGGLAGSYALPAGVGSVGVDAFESCQRLTNVSIPASVSTIADGAFSGCTTLTAIAVDATNSFYTSTNGVLFDKTLSTLVEFPGGLPGSYAVPGSVTSIAEDAFENCRSLTNVTIPGGVTNVGDGALLGCSDLMGIAVDTTNSFYSSTNGVLFNKNQTKLIVFPGGLAGSYSIPGTVTNIAEDAFENCQRLDSVTIPGGVTAIGPGAFENCYALADLTIPIGVASIESNVFENCYNLASIMIPAGVTNIGEEAFEYCLSLASVTIPASVTDIGEEAFEYCSGLASVTIPGNVTNIGEGAFAYCSSLASVTIPASVSSIGPYTFYECAGLTSVTIPESVSSIGNGAFEQCYSLAGVTIPLSTSSIGDNAFNDCTSLTNVTIPGGVTSIGDDAFVNCASLLAITVDVHNPSYSSTNGVLFDKNQTTLIEYPGGLAGNYTLPGGVSSIESNAFENCQSLTGLTIPGSVTNIGDGAFTGTLVTTFYFTGNAPAVDSSAFDSGNNPAVYYLPGTTGWAGFFANTGLTVAVWNPVIQTSDGGFGAQDNQFGFNLNGPTNLVVVVEACTNLASPVWTPLQTVTLTNGLFHFSEPLQNSISGRFYGLGLP